MGHYRVKSGDTLYSIAWANGLDYRTLKTINNLPASSTIHPGQILAVREKRGVKRLLIGKENKYTHISSWHWPARGIVQQAFSKKPFGNKGVNISGRYGESIMAAQNGIVVYSGAGVRGYGNLIIVKHSDSFLSAYAFNQRNLVHEGERVKVGQRIALMGRNNAGRVLLHFEIRKNGKPVDPALYLHY